VATFLARLSGALLLACALFAAGGSRAGDATHSCGRCHAAHFEKHGSCTACHRGDPATTRRALAHDRLLTGAAAAWGMPDHLAPARGEQMRDQLGCRRCHVSGGRGNALALSLDEAVWQRSQAQLRAALTEPASFMPDFSLTAAQADTLVAALLRDGKGTAGGASYLVRFRQQPERPTEAFTVRCGGCHRALTSAGALGTSASGPNLSGLLTEFYPVADGRRWSRERLERWLRNPRAERPEATMRPVALQPGELEEIAQLLGPAPTR
jgi:hypothetical protein